MTFTTASSTPFWRKRSFFRLALLACILLTDAVRAEGISVQSAMLDPVEETYQLNANFEINFSQTIEDAVNRGVTLPFIIEYEITRPRWYWLDETVAVGARSRQVFYNALTRQYRMTVGSGDAPEKAASLYQNFDRLEDVKRVLASVRAWDVIDRKQLKKGTSYDLAVRMRLDVSRLPKPFQVNALASREWDLASDWYRFTYTP